MTDYDLTRKYENRGVPPKWFYCLCAWLMFAWAITVGAAWLVAVFW